MCSGKGECVRAGACRMCGCVCMCVCVCVCVCVCACVCVSVRLRVSECVYRECNQVLPGKII